MRAVLLTLAALAALGCTGRLEGRPTVEGSGPGSGPSESSSDPGALCEFRALPIQPLRRLSSTQYHNTLAELFGPALAQPLLEGSLFPITEIEVGFQGDAEANVVNTAESNAIEDNAARIAALVLQNADPYLRALLPCALPETIDDATIDGCVDGFIDDFGRKAYRRLVTDGEHTVLRGLYDELRAQQGARAAWSAILQVFVQAPALLYRVERGADQVAPGIVRLTGHEMATRLSYFLNDSAPDAELFAAAEAGALETVAQVVAQAERLLAGASFDAVTTAFHRDWLHLYKLERATRDAELFPDFDAEARQSLLSEPAALVRHVMQDGDGTIRSLLGGSTVVVNARLAMLYGVEPPAEPGAWAPVTLADRRGLLTSAAFMATLAESNRTNPIHRGAFIQREILCNELPSLPGDVDTSTPLSDTSGLPTARERLAPLMERADCSGCHTVFNPTGLAFESYDAIGAYRSEENGVAIDASGQIDLGAGRVSFTTAVELSELIAGSEQAAACYALHWYRAALGRKEFAEDACSVATLRQSVVESGGDIRQLLIALVQTDGFLYRSGVVQ